jgi:hypothetical protein
MELQPDKERPFLLLVFKNSSRLDINLCAVWKLNDNLQLPISANRSAPKWTQQTSANHHHSLLQAFGAQLAWFLVFDVHCLGYSTLQYLSALLT